MADIEMQWGVQRANKVDGRWITLITRKGPDALHQATEALEKNQLTYPDYQWRLAWRYISDFEAIIDDEFED